MPSINGIPPTAPAASAGPTKVNDVPCTERSPVPTGPMRITCVTVEMPEAKSAMLTKNDVSSGGRPRPVAMMRGGVMMPTNMASVCWNAMKNVSRTGGRDSTA